MLKWEMRVIFGDASGNLRGGSIQILSNGLGKYGGHSAIFDGAEVFECVPQFPIAVKRNNSHWLLARNIVPPVVTTTAQPDNLKRVRVVFVVTVKRISRFSSTFRTRSRPLQITSRDGLCDQRRSLCRKVAVQAGLEALRARHYAVASGSGASWSPRRAISACSMSCCFVQSSRVASISTARSIGFRSRIETATSSLFRGIVFMIALFVVLLMHSNNTE